MFFLDCTIIHSNTSVQGYAWGAALVLIVIVMVLNVIARLLGRIFAPKSGH